MIEIKNNAGKVLHTVDSDKLRGAYLSGADLRSADLQNADLQNAYLSGADLRSADLRGANLRGASLWRANMQNADLWATIGNMREIKSAQFDRWAVTWTRSPEGKDIVQIGCQSHPLDRWREGGVDWLTAMDPDAGDWWCKYMDLISAMVNTSPATPWGKS